MTHRSVVRANNRIAAALPNARKELKKKLYILISVALLLVATIVLLIVFAKQLTTTSGVIGGIVSVGLSIATTLLAFKYYKSSMQMKKVAIEFSGVAVGQLDKHELATAISEAVTAMIYVEQNKKEDEDMFDHIDHIKKHYVYDYMNKHPDTIHEMMEYKDAYAAVNAYKNTISKLANRIMKYGDYQI